MSRLVVACLARNEADRFWRSALAAWSNFADTIIVLDDASEDDTRKIASDFGKVRVYETVPGTGAAWGSEAPARKVLWDCIISETKPGDYVLILDADMTPARDIRPLLTVEPDAIAFPLYDLWGEDDHGRLLYREDRYWQAHLHPRVWLFRVNDDHSSREWLWSPRGIHCGHLPLNFTAERTLIAPRDYSLLHYGYFTPEIRAEKHARYASVSDQLSDFERRHAQSILDPNPHLLPLPFDPELRLELASP